MQLTKERLEIASAVLQALLGLSGDAEERASLIRADKLVRGTGKTPEEPNGELLQAEVAITNYVLRGAIGNSASIRSMPSEDLSI